jgi:hypothetical protein
LRILQERAQRVRGQAKLQSLGETTFPLTGDDLLKRYDEIGARRAKLERMPSIAKARRRRRRRPACESSIVSSNVGASGRAC